MPSYSQGASLLSIGPGESVVVWNAQVVAAGAGGVSASQQIALVRLPGEPGTPFEVSAFFVSDPGSFEVDVQVADEDIDSHYQTVANGNITTVDATNQTFHFDGATIRAKFVRLLMRTLSNAVAVTATISR
jgi:hypothetical protein